MIIVFSDTYRKLDFHVFQIIINELEKDLKELILDKVSIILYISKLRLLHNIVLFSLLTLYFFESSFVQLQF